MRLIFSLLCLAPATLSGPVSAFTHPICAKRSTSNISALFMGMKGGKAGRQMELAKKMAMAKEQARKKDDGEDTTEVAKDDGKKNRLSDEAIKLRNDMQRFDDLLKSESATVAAEFNTASGYLTNSQQEEAATAGFKGIDRIYEGDPAPEEPFEGLVNIESENVLGKKGASHVVPWLRNNSARHKDYLVIICDPREKSSELRQALSLMAKGLSKELLDKTIVINADNPPETRRWLKKNDASSLTVFSDKKREWMREYTALGDKRWAMNMFVLGDGRVQKVVRELDGDLVCSVVKNAVKFL